MKRIFLFFILSLAGQAVVAQSGSGPEELVEAQLEAYNRQDLEAFLLPFSDTIRLYDHPDDLWCEGKTAMRAIYRKLFERTDHLHCDIQKRIVLGNTVIDHEKVSLHFGDQEEEIQAIAIYKIRNGSIVEVYFIE
jgi:hypothetical protein